MEAFWNKITLSYSNEIPFLFPGENSSTINLLEICENWILKHFYKYMNIKDPQCLVYN